MLKIINTSNMDEISAFLTTTLVSHSYEVESTQSIVTLWDDLRKNIELKGDLDFVSAMLATGRIMDYGMEIKDRDFISNTINDINKNIEGRKIELVDFQKELVSALIAAARIARSEEVESIRQIVDLWVRIKNGIAIKNDLDLIAAVLTIGRIMELKIKVESFPTINDIFTGIRKELEERAGSMSVTQKELAAAFITAAYIEVSPKVEKIRDMVDFWLKISSQISCENQWDYITMILSSGKIKDMDAFHISDPENLKNTYGKIREHLKVIVGE